MLEMFSLELRSVEEEVVGALRGSPSLSSPHLRAEENKLEKNAACCRLPNQLNNKRPRVGHSRRAGLYDCRNGELQLLDELVVPPASLLLRGP